MLFSIILSKYTLCKYALTETFSSNTDLYNIYNVVKNWYGYRLFVTVRVDQRPLTFMTMKTVGIWMVVLDPYGR